MGRKAIWVTAEQILEAFKTGVMTKQKVQNYYFAALRANKPERAELFKSVLEVLESQK